MTYSQFIKAVENRKAICGFHRGTGRDRMPAAFIASMPFWLVSRSLSRLKIYKPKRKKS